MVSASESAVFLDEREHERERTVFDERANALILNNSVYTRRTSTKNVSNNSYVDVADLKHDTIDIQVSKTFRVENLEVLF